jgi:hypothetical protein
MKNFHEVRSLGCDFGLGREKGSEGWKDFF